MEKYEKLLKDNRIRMTHHRLEVLKYLDEHRTHPTVDEIYSDLKEGNPSLSKTTVYNTLETFERQGIIQPLSISGSELRYDFKTKIHHHFLCKKCGQIIDIDIECPNIDKVLESGHQVMEVHGYFKGICKDCLNKNKEGS